MSSVRASRARRSARVETTTDSSSSAQRLPVAETPLGPRTGTAGKAPARTMSRSGFMHHVMEISRNRAVAVAAVLIGAMVPNVAGAEPRRPEDRPPPNPVVASGFGPPDPPLRFGPELWTTLPDGRRVNLIPSLAELRRWDAQGLLSSGPVGTSTVAVPTTRRYGGDPALDTLLTGVPDSVRERPWTASFDDYFRARAALSEVPTALAGMALKPVGDRLYQVVDQIPAPIRRPFDRALGILLDNAVSLPANLLTSRLMVNGGPLPESAQLALGPYPQILNSCGETMVATWLKGQGVPVALGELDTQLPFFEGFNLLEDAELRNRGFSLISGPGSFDDLRTYVAHGYPVMVSVGWEGGGGHYAVVTGYDQRTNTVTIDGWNADGKVARVPYDEFRQAWGRHLNLMTVAHPQRDTRLSELRRQGRIAREARIQEGLSLSDIWVTQRLELFVEAAYRYRGTKDDLIVRLNVNSAERPHGVANMLGGSVRYAHRFDNGTTVDIYAEHVATTGPQDAESLQAYLRSSALYVGLRHGPVSGRIGYDRGAFQAALQADLNRRLYSLGAEARVSVDPDGNYRVFLGVQGRF